jgi:geranylgeranyl pyrophosphate synthase
VTRSAGGAFGVESEPETAFELDVYLAHEQSLVDDALARSFNARRASLPDGIAAAVQHGLGGAGKRLRPVLCVSAYRACDHTPPAAVYDLAASLELIHAYSLMHDDLPCMDDAELRRGAPSTHRIHGVHATAVAGAAMIPLAVLQATEACAALGLDAGTGAEVAAELCAAAGGRGMVAGQVIDRLAEQESLSSDGLDALHRLKTGALLRAALRMGGLAARADRDTLRALDTYGRAVGLAFQIADDVLDATATSEALGKNPSDALLGKSTYVSLHGLEEARRRAAVEVERAKSALTEVGLGAGNPRAAALHALATFAVSRAR